MSGSRMMLEPLKGLKAFVTTHDKTVENLRVRLETCRASSLGLRGDIEERLKSPTLSRCSRIQRISGLEP